MKTKKQADEQRQRIENGYAPDIGQPYHNVLNSAKHNNLAGELHFVATDDWWATAYATLPARTKMLQRMKLINAKFVLTKLGRWYDKNYDWRTVNDKKKRHDAQ